MSGPNDPIPTVEMEGPGGLRVVNDLPNDIADARDQGYTFKDEDREVQYSEQEKAAHSKRNRTSAPEDKAAKKRDKDNEKLRKDSGLPSKPHDAKSASKIREGVQPSTDDRLEAQRDTVAIREGKGAQTAAGSGLSPSDAKENADFEAAEETTKASQE